MKKIQTLCLIYKHPQILLGMKKRGFGVGKWNGYGGKPQGDETVEEAIKRELTEEAGINVLDIDKVGLMEFYYGDDEDYLEVHIFKSYDFEGEIVESEEMKPEWFHIDDLPFDSMWPDDRHWMPLFLAGKRFKGKFIFDKENNILEKELIEIDNF